MTSLAYNAGRSASLHKLGFIGLSKLIKPALGGAAFGGTVGGLSAPEGHGSEGVLRGALLGAAGGAAGRAAGGAMQHLSNAPGRLSAATKAVNTGRAKFLKRNPGKAGNKLYAQSKPGMKNIQEMTEAQQRVKSMKKVPTGMGMLGAVGGTGLAGVQTERNAATSSAQDPYGYRYR